MTGRTPTRWRSGNTRSQAARQRDRACPARSAAPSWGERRRGAAGRATSCPSCTGRRVGRLTSSSAPTSPPPPGESPLRSRPAPGARALLPTIDCRSRVPCAAACTVAAPHAPRLSPPARPRQEGGRAKDCKGRVCHPKGRVTDEGGAAKRGRARTRRSLYFYLQAHPKVVSAVRPPPPPRPRPPCPPTHAAARVPASRPATSPHLCARCFAEVLPHATRC